MTEERAQGGLVPARNEVKYSGLETFPSVVIDKLICQL
jgi:hypothetical protein